ncbi:MAG TPA: metal-sensing transcriptional repressor [Candidatus Dojkabacteria bacterium]|mgnify:CR=1 FL=1|nr:metal-sensing transcriptional repressor [Candidatus Dojkabacteria bacterium]HQG57443.1 metal-sensing transcriptional repressor [Candidatus Dojkabacteria bacterium]
MAKKGPASISDRLNRVEGQIRGIEKLIAEGESTEKILPQLQAIISGIENVKLEMIKEQMKKQLLSELDKVVDLLK